MKNESVLVLVQHRARSGMEETAKIRLAELIGTVLSEEPACLDIAMYQDIDDPTRIHLHERWSDKDSFQGPHMHTPHIRAFIRQADEFLAGPPDISFWHAVDQF